MTIEQRRACTEMLEILNKFKYLSSKIPNSLIEKMNEEKDNDWKFEYDETVALENQKILYSTKVLFSYIYITYIASEENAKELKEIYEMNSRKKYNPDNIFKRENVQIDKNNLNINSRNNQVLTTEKWYQRLFNAIKSVLKK